MMSWGTALLSRSAMGRGVSPGNATSTRATCSAAVAVPRTRIRRLPQHVEGRLHVLRGEGHPIVPFDAGAQEEDERPVVVLPRPPFRQLSDDAVDAVGWLRRVEEDQVAETRHGGPQG